MTKKDLNYIVKLEKAITDKYGDVAVQDPRSNWNEQKEQEYLEQIKQLSEKERELKQSSERVEKDGFFISKKLLNKESNRNCPVCGDYSFAIKDDLYMNKFDCCFRCYIKYVEGREERWSSGWRPDKQGEE